MRGFEDRLAARLAPLSVIVFGGSEAILTAWRTAAQASGFGTRVGGHADIAETSVMLALHADSVRSDRMEPGLSVDTDDAFLARVFDEGLKALSPMASSVTPRARTRRSARPVSPPSRS